MKCPKCNSIDWDWANIGFSEAKQCLDCGEIYLERKKTMTMSYEEQQAFIEAYDENVGMYSKMQVERIVEGYFNAEDVSYNEGFEHVLDCLMIWMKAIVYQMKKDNPK